MTSATPRPMATPDLAGLLSKPPRPVKILNDPIPAEIPPAGQPKTPMERPPEVQPPMEAVGAPTVALAETKARRPVRPKPSPPVQQPDANDGRPAERQYLRSIALYLPRSLYRTVGKHAESHSTTRTAVILTAVNHTHHQLSRELVADSPAARGGGDLFDIPQERTEKEPSVQTSIRVTDQQLDAMDSLARKLETNRSRLIATALSLYLGS
jgi:hypothetical protein